MLSTGVDLKQVSVKKLRKDGKYDYVYEVVITGEDYTVKCVVTHMLLIYCPIEDYEYDYLVQTLTLNGKNVSMENTSQGVVAMIKVLDDLAYLIRHKAFDIKRLKLFDNY
jgi:hypothetical protein